MHHPDKNTTSKQRKKEIAEEFASVIGPDHLITEEERVVDYGRDKTEDYLHPPDFVLFPQSAEEISALFKICANHKIPVTPRGGGTGLTGGAIPVHGGATIAMERFDKILSIDELNLQATVEPGVITEIFQNAVRERGLFYPPDPASKGSCFLGGNLANNSGGPKAVKYGVTRDYVINMEVVIPTGEIIWTGANVLKNSTGYNLTHLICGSEGTLGIITKIVFKLRGYPEKDVLLLIPFASSEEACKAISAIFTAGIIPSGMEFFEREAGVKTVSYCQQVLSSPVKMRFPENMNAYLLCELDGNDEEVLMRDADRIVQEVEQFNIGELLFADSLSQKEELWKVRRNISPAVNWNTVSKSEDVVVPRSQLPKLVSGIKEIGKQYNFETVCFGHLGDGNLHVNILRNDISDKDWAERVPEGIKEIFQLTVSLGGTLSGEHGIGMAKRPYLPMALDEPNIRIMREIKKIFDPCGILNPGKIF